MAYMSQEKKSELAPRIKAILRKYGVKGSLGVYHHSTLCLNIASGPIDFIGNVNAVAGGKHDEQWIAAKDHIDVNPYWYREHFDGAALDFLSEVIPVMNEGNHDRSDMMTDYFDVGWYVSVKVGRWNKPYQLVGPAQDVVELVNVRKSDPAWEKEMLSLEEWK